MKKLGMLIAFCGVLTVSCHKKETHTDQICLANCPLNAGMFKFRVVDKQTGQDYFFSNPPGYPISALHIKGLQDTTDANFYTDSSEHFFVILCPVTGNYSYRVLVGNLEPDTVQFVVGTIPMPNNTGDARVCCLPPFTIQQMQVNGQAVSDYSDSTALEIKK